VIGLAGLTTRLYDALAVCAAVEIRYESEPPLGPRER